MIIVNDLRNGMTFKYNDNLFITLESQHSKSARGQAHVKVKVKNLRTSAITNIVFTGGEKVARAYLDKKVMQFLYSSDNQLIFMDNETYEQIEIMQSKMKWEMNFLITGQMVQVLKYEDEILTVNLPDKVILKVISAEQAVKGDSTSNPTKQATLETGWSLQVPIFINQDDKISVSTLDGKYHQRA